MIPVDILFEILEYLNRKDCSVLLGVSNKLLSKIVSHYRSKLKRKMPVVSYPCKLVGWPGGMDGAPVLAVINTGDISISVTEKMLISTSLADVEFTQVDGTVALKNLVTQTYIGVLVFQRKVVTRSSAVPTNTAGGIPLDPEAICSAEQVASEFIQSIEDIRLALPENAP